MTPASTNGHTHEPRDDAPRHEHEHDSHENAGIGLGINVGFPPLQLKGEVMDLEFTLDTDHRKRRRNRTTQSCLNCHTSKRKCDRKRPCQRCIQLGLTGLCVYEIDDPALRDDPSVDENTRLRNRIAELESLVRELRGKPHPRWADSTFRDGDPNEKWHSRATKCAPLPKRRHSPSSPTHHLASSAHDPHLSHPPSLLPPIKTEGAATAGLYRFASPPLPSRYPNTGTLDFEYPATHALPLSHSQAQDQRERERYRGYCGCRSSPTMAHAYIALAHALQGALKHPPGAGHAQGCLLFRRVADLASLMQGTDPTDPAGPAYDGSGTTPTDGGGSDGTGTVLTPLSSSAGTGGGGSAANSFHGSPDAYHPSPPGGYHHSASSPSAGYHAGSPGAYHTGSPGAYHASAGSPGAYHTGSPGYHPASPGAYPSSPGAYGPGGTGINGAGGGVGGGGGSGGGGGEWLAGPAGYNPYFPLQPGGEHIYGAHVIA